MKNRLTYLLLPAIAAVIGTAQAATITVTTADDGVSNIGAAGTFYRALTNCAPGDTIAFNIPGTGPHHLKPPPGGFPLVYQKHNLTINGYTQPGSAVNTAPITATNNAVIKIVVDSSNGNFTDMAYVYYGTLAVSVPPINNSQLYGDGGSTKERGGYDPDSTVPYVPGEVASLGIYRSTNVTVKGLAFIGGGVGAGGYLVAVAQDFGYDTSIRERYTYDGGSSRGLHVAGCWFGIDPGTGADAGGGAAIAMFRHRDHGGLAATDRRPSVLTDPNDEGIPNGEASTIGVKAGSANPRAEFNVFGSDFEASIAAELCRTRISGNQIMAATDIGRYNDTAIPGMLFGTDGDGVNDADEGNLFLATLSLYNTRGKLYVIAGNTFNRARDGSRPGIGFGFAYDGFGLDQGTAVRFGSDFNGVSDALEANHVFDAAFGTGVNGNAQLNGSFVSMRGNELVNNVTPPIDESLTGYWGKFMDATGGPRPVITSLTGTVLSGTCNSNLPPYSKVYIDVYKSDPEGDAANDPQGTNYLGTFLDNGPADTNPAVGAFSFNVSSLGLTSGTKVTLTANYANESKPTISSITSSGGNVTLTITGGNPTYNILRASSITGPWTSIALLVPSTIYAPASITVPGSGSQSYYRVGALSFAQQTSPFAMSVAVP